MLKEANTLSAQRNAALYLLTKYFCLTLTVDQNGRTALMHATENGHEETINMLLDEGAGIDVQDNVRSSWCISRNEFFIMRLRDSRPIDHWILTCLLLNRKASQR